MAAQEIVKINNTYLEVLMYKGQRILTTQQLAEGYETEPRRISENFNANKDRYVLGKHYYLLEGEELKAFGYQYGNSVSVTRVSKLYLWTERGALYHAKSLGTDRAWEIYDILVEAYFRKKISSDKVEALKEINKAVKLISNPKIKDKVMTAALQEIIGVDINQHSEEPESEDNPINQFIQECLAIDPKSQIYNKRLTELYNSWSSNDYSETKFALAFNPVAIRLGLKKIRNSKGNVWKGIKSIK